MTRTLTLIIFVFATANIVSIQSLEYTVTDQLYMEVFVKNEFIGRIIIGLFGEIVPKTTKNFIELCTKGINGKSYIGSKFHRVIERFMIQGGALRDDDGMEILSIYDNAYFEDENLRLFHSGPGFVSMANAGPNTNGCQFFITTIATPWLDGTHVIFGKVLQGQNIVHKIEHFKTDVNDRPLNDVIIADCGIIPTPNPFVIYDSSFNALAWLKASFVPLGFSFAILAFFHWVIRQL